MPVSELFDPEVWVASEDGYRYEGEESAASGGRLSGAPYSY